MNIKKIDTLTDLIIGAHIATIICYIFNITIWPSLIVTLIGILLLDKEIRK